MAFKKIVDALPPQGKKIAESVSAQAAQRKLLSQARTLLSTQLKNWAIYRGGVAGNSVLKPNEYRKAPAYVFHRSNQLYAGRSRLLLHCSWEPRCCLRRSHAPPVIPGRQDDNIYDITYYSRDFSRNNPLAKDDLTEADALLDSPQGPNMLIPKQADELVQPSPGRKVRTHGSLAYTVAPPCTPPPLSCRTPMWRVTPGTDFGQP